MASPDETRGLLIDALLRLIRHQSLSEISVRDVAAEAGVNHGLVHRHFGSRENLVRAATAQVAEALHRAPPDGSGLAASTFRALAQRPEVVRVLASACLDGRAQLLQAASPSPERLEEIVASVRAAMGDLGLAWQPDPQVLNAYVVSSILGWWLFRPALAEGFGLPDDADDQIETLLELLDQLVSGDLMGAGD